MYKRQLHIQRLLREPPHAAVGDFLDKDIEPVAVDVRIGEVTRTLATYNLVSLPVVDEDQRLLGAVTVDDVLDHILPEDWREDRHEEISEDDIDPDQDEPGAAPARDGASVVTRG